MDYTDHILYCILFLCVLILLLSALAETFNIVDIRFTARLSNLAPPRRRGGG
jgi:hypothetical protein